jgi:hypothetical protein
MNTSLSLNILFFYQLGIHVFVYPSVPFGHSCCGCSNGWQAVSFKSTILYIRRLHECLAFKQLI